MSIIPVARKMKSETIKEERTAWTMVARVQRSSKGGSREVKEYRSDSNPRALQGLRFPAALCVETELSSERGSGVDTDYKLCVRFKNSNRDGMR
jgi:hypothetical protein